MSKENKTTTFGNMKLGKINEMLVSFIGEDAFLDYCEKHHKDWGLDNWHSRDAFSKHLQRLFEEKESSYRDLNPNYDQSVYRIAYKILNDFCNKYGLPRYIADTILDFYDLPTLQLSKTKYPICETHYMLDIVICGILPIFVKKTVAEIDTNNEISFSYLDAETKYNTVFDKLGKQFKSLEKFYRELDTYEGKIEHFKKIILTYCKKGQNPDKWNDMKAVLDFCKKAKKEKEAARLIEAYLTANVQNFIKAEIPESDWKKIKSCFESIGKNVFNKFIAEKKKSGDTTYLKEKCLYLTITPLGLLHQMLLESMGDKSEPINLALWDILKRHIYLQDEKRAEGLISNIKEIAPEASGFYSNWLHAYIEVAKGEFDEAKDLYNEAFGNIHFAGIWTKSFLKQAFALSVYLDANQDAVRNAIDPDPEKPSQTPLPNDGKRFWEYGYAIGVFDKPAEDAFLEYVYRKENFSAEFPQEMFSTGKGIDHDRIKATIEDLVFYKEKIKERIDQDYIRLSAIKEKSINKRMTIFNGDGKRMPLLFLPIRLFSITSHGRFFDLEEKLPPLSLAIRLFNFSSDERFLDLIERWLGLSDPETAIKDLKFNIISDLGETPLNAATMAYKDFCTKNSAPESPVKKRLRKIVIHILDKTDKDHLGIDTKRERIHALQNVIDSCDIDLVKEFVERSVKECVKKSVKVGLDIDSIRLTPDKVSPVYYTIGRILYLQNPKARFEHHENTNLKYLDASGITAEDRKMNFDNKMNRFTPEIQKAITEYCIKDEFGDESTYLEQIEKLKEICLYLIYLTKDQDAYKFSNNLGAEWTSLTLAAETDDVDICRALLEHGADPNIPLLESEWGNEIPNTFLHRCIEHDAWHVLEMFLTDFKDAASKTIKKYNNSGIYAPFAFFFEKNKEKSKEFLEKFIKLFESCGADFTISSTNKSEEKPQ